MLKKTLFVLLCLVMSVFVYSQKKIIFSKTNIQVGKVKIEVELADTKERIRRGLMFRNKLGKEEGMLFIFSKEQELNFWMKNTFIPLSIGFFNKEKVLIDIQEMKPVASEMEKPNTYASKKPAKYALEVSQGWFKRHKIELGAKLKLPH